jgi:Domain of unknown function (DUF4105)
VGPARRWLSVLGLALLRLALLLLALWCAAALWIDGPAARWLAGLLAAVCAAFSLAFLFRRPARRKLLLAALPCAVVLGWWLSLQPRNDRSWQREVERQASCTWKGEVATIANVRNFARRSGPDDEPRWETRSYDLAQVSGLDLFLCYWGPRAIAHTILSWEFADGRHLAISIETRPEVGEEYSAVRGFFRQFELCYVVADERDVIRVRTDERGEDLYLYRLRTSPERARALLHEYLDAVNGLVAQPRWYNALETNCTTVIFDHVRPIVGRMKFDVRMLANGHLDELLQEDGVVNTSLPFEALRQASRISEAARAAGDSPGFSAAIRKGLPPRPPPPPEG